MYCSMVLDIYGLHTVYTSVYTKVIVRLTEYKKLDLHLGKALKKVGIHAARKQYS